MSWRCRLTRLAGGATAPLLPPLLRYRAARGKESPERLRERQGFGAERPDGPLIWLHAASVGESLSLLPLMETLLEQRPGLHLLVTTGTVTAAGLLEQRLPPAVAARVIHRFAPLDVPGWIARFLDGWRPDAVAIAESELWPNRTYALSKRGIPAAMINARISPRSAALWRRWAPGLARDLLARFALVVAQSEDDAARLRDLGAEGAACWGNLKAAAAPLPADAAELERLRALIGQRPVFLAASTHPGEDEPALAAHRALAPRLPGLLTVIAPRHPDRGAEVAALAAQGTPPLSVSRRAEGGRPEPGVEVYVADTLGELGLFFRLAGVALVGGSLVPKGGHNPLEPARLGCPVLFGPHTEHFREVADALLAAGGALRVENARTLAENIQDVLTNPERASTMTRAAAKIADNAAHLPGALAEAILALLPSGPGISAKGSGSGLDEKGRVQG
ncbi:3-deoxy-D-manno-octulosonic acid transferase [Roseomonas marmotae]|uniref:3-deoxy-D-manno-octulosonic acid transferase n=1 Tax=Roseomonas marmotae TaxID=2768161 RepID=A0ABS3K6X0_9PROT|nr:3-deoxy-D-manno-octulosonic acid transferase [Roseomonas marmotae]MBO1073204.1 3-deoxy-D-manno-octulosonic acid transferase [Roseomonas marmotae]QTI79166.1 3-deoxy-D-manno-octulosonic acid transferase [Roseomonas marmotae]